MKQIILLFAIMLVLPLASATDTIGPFELNNTVGLLQVCDNCTQVNITTVTLPNASRIYFNTPMTQNGSIYNFTFNSTNRLGTYIYTTCGDPNGIFTCGSVDFEITKTGSDLTTGQAIIYFFFMITLIITFGFCFYWALKLPFRYSRSPDGTIVNFNDLRYLKMFLIMVCYMLLMFIFGIIRAIAERFLFFSEINTVFTWLYWTMFSAFFPILIVTIVIALVTFLTGKRLKKAIERGVPMIR